MRQVIILSKAAVKQQPLRTQMRNESKPAHRTATNDVLSTSEPLRTGGFGHGGGNHGHDTLIKR